MVQRQNILFQKQQNFSFSNIIAPITHIITPTIYSLNVYHYQRVEALHHQTSRFYEFFQNNNKCNFILFTNVSVPVKLGWIWSLQGKNIESSTVLFFEHMRLLFLNLSLEYLTSYLVHKHRSVTLVTSNSVLLSNCPRISYRKFLGTKKEKENCQRQLKSLYSSIR